MGYNIDMVKMFGDFNVTCPICGYKTPASSTHLTDIDVDGSDFNPESGVWQIGMVCYARCGNEFILKLKITAKQEEI